MRVFLWGVIFWVVLKRFKSQWDINIYARDASAAAMGYLSLNKLYENRFALGLESRMRLLLSKEGILMVPRSKKWANI